MFGNTKVVVLKERNYKYKGGTVRATNKPVVMNVPNKDVESVLEQIKASGLE